MEAKEILSITKCGDLFPYGEDRVREMYIELAKKWHPDTNHNPDASDVFAKITELYRRALRLLEAGEWEKTNYVLLSREDGGKVAFNYDTFFTFELGVCYVTKSKIVYVLDSGKGKYYDNAVRRIKGLRYQDKKMEDEFGRFLPEINRVFQAKNGEYVIVLEKAGDIYPLKKVFACFANRMDGRHVAWMISRLCNLACYLKFSGLVHNGINMDNCFISPKDHSVLLLGGWWYATAENEKMIGTTKDIFSVMPVAAKGAGKSSAITDLESVKLLGRQLLGEANGRKLWQEDSVPKPFLRFVTGGSGGDSYEEFSKWDRALSASYGERKFIPMELPGNIYEREET